MPVLFDFKSLPELFDGLCDRFQGQNRTALSYFENDSKTWVDISWEEFRDKVFQIAGYLYSRGIRTGDRVAIISENRPEWAFIDMATQLLGAVNVSLYTSLPAKQVEYILQDSGSRILFVSTNIQLKKAISIFGDCPELSEVVVMSPPKNDLPEFVISFERASELGAEAHAQHLSEIGELRNKVNADMLSALIYTSGTTGVPKGVMLTHQNLCENAVSALKTFTFNESDLHLSFLPLCHSFERTAGYTAIMACGARITYARSIDSVARDLLEVKPTIMISVPRLYEKMYNAVNKLVEEGSAAKKAVFKWSLRAGEKYAQRQMAGKSIGPLLGLKKAIAHRLVFSKIHEKMGGNVRFCISGAAALPKAIAEFFMAAGLPILEGYGLTETSPALALNPLEQPRFGTVGRIIHGVTVGIQSLEDGSMIGEQSGSDYPSELNTGEGEIVARGPNIMKGYWNNMQATAEAIDENGWYHTGDVGRFDAGYLMITDRIKHMIVSKGGKNIYPGPIEENFVTEASIGQLMTIGEGREFLSALVVPDEDYIRRFAKNSNISESSLENLLENDAVKNIFATIFKQYSRQAAAHEKIRRFRLIAEPFTVENGMLTPTLKVKRKEVEKEYAQLIESMYEGVIEPLMS